MAEGTITTWKLQKGDTSGGKRYSSNGRLARDRSILARIMVRACTGAAQVASRIAVLAEPGDELASAGRILGIVLRDKRESHLQYSSSGVSAPNLPTISHEYCTPVTEQRLPSNPCLGF